MKAVQELHFNVGKKLLGEILRGISKSESVRKNRLDRLGCFGTLAYSEEEIDALIDDLLLHGFIEQSALNGNKWWKVITLTQKGKREIETPSYHKKRLAKAIFDETRITDNDREIFSHFDFFLGRFNEEQKKAVICASEKILCVAGAGTGKTTVLAKRIEFLTQYRSIPPEEILAITFTRKAKEHMEKKLSISPYCAGVVVETFNSFAEKILKKHNDLIYEKPVSMMSYGEKIRLVRIALKNLGTSMEQSILSYFSPTQRRIKSDDTLSLTFVNDCFSILDYYKNEGKDMPDFSKDTSLTENDRETARMIHNICSEVQKLMLSFGKRDFSDQVNDCVRLFSLHPDAIPKFSHVLIDEYQDINPIQSSLIDLLASQNIFCVGDPRQSIFGWRGSDISYIMDFRQKFPVSEIITLRMNYRSKGNIIGFVNAAIKNMNLPDLVQQQGMRGGEVSLKKFEDTGQEFSFITHEILRSTAKRSEIFILCRTNKMLLEISERLKGSGIAHTVKSEEYHETRGEGEPVILATLHAIKGLEASQVFIAGCHSLNFPCRASDHPIMDVIKFETYDKEEEERRLLYVGMSRAKESLTLTYSAMTATKFINEQMKKMVNIDGPDERDKGLAVGAETASETLRLQLDDWRRALARKEGLPVHLILPDRAVEELLQVMPLSVDELEVLSEMPKGMKRRHGATLIGIISRTK